MSLVFPLDHPEKLQKVTFFLCNHYHTALFAVRKIRRGSNGCYQKKAHSLGQKGRVPCGMISSSVTILFVHIVNVMPVFVTGSFRSLVKPSCAMAYQISNCKYDLI